MGTWQVSTSTHNCTTSNFLASNQPYCYHPMPSTWYTNELEHGKGKNTCSTLSWSSGVASAPRSRGPMASKSSCLISSVLLPFFLRNEGKNETFVLHFGTATGLESSQGLLRFVGTLKGKWAEEEDGRWEVTGWRFLWVVREEREEEADETEEAMRERERERVCERERDVGGSTEKGLVVCVTYQQYGLLYFLISFFLILYISFPWENFYGMVTKFFSQTTELSAHYSL